MEINITVTITHPDGETRYALHAPTIEIAIEKLGALDRKLNKETKQENDYLSNCCGAIAESHGLCSDCKEPAEFSNEE